MVTIYIWGDPQRFRNYSRAVTAAGGRVQFGGDPTGCDGLLLPGGGDLEPWHYGQENMASHGLEPQRDWEEMELLEWFTTRKKPVLGICRGMQVINVALGGDLIQDLPGELLPFHGRSDHDLVHPIRAAEGSLLHRLYGPLFPVNSTHHQAVDALGKGFRATAWAESGFVEAMEHESLPLIAVQFHPERMAYHRRREDTVDGAPLLCHFLELCRG